MLNSVCQTLSKSKMNTQKRDKDQQHHDKETKTRMPKNGIATCL